MLGCSASGASGGRERLRSEKTGGMSSPSGAEPRRSPRVRAEPCGLQRAVPAPPELLCRDYVGAAGVCRELYLGTGSPGKRWSPHPWEC